MIDIRSIKSSSKAKRVSKDTTQRNDNAKEYIKRNFEKGSLCDLNFPVYVGYTYFADDDFVISYVSGTARDLLRDLRDYYKKDYRNIYTCTHLFKDV